MTNTTYRYRYVYLGIELNSALTVRREVHFVATPEAADFEGRHQLDLSGALEHGTAFRAIVRERIGPADAKSA